MFFLTFFVIFIIIADQFIKYLIVNNMFLGQSIPLITDILHLTYILNPGAAFGILENQRLFFIFIAIILIFAIVYFRTKILHLSKLFQLGIAMLFSGAIGNMIDRIFIGKVVDYIDFRVWPIFNLADIAIVCGCIIVIYELLFMEQKHSHD